MIRPVARFIDAYRIWHKVTFERGRILRTSGASWQDHDRPDHYADPRRFFPAGGLAPDLSFTTEETRRGARVRRFTFPTLHPIGTAAWRRTDTARGRLYLPAGLHGSPVIVLSHGWAHEDVKGIEAIYISPLLKAGFAVAMTEHAFHLDRTPEGTYSGELMVSGDVVLTVEAFRQSVADLCGLVSWLRQEGAGRIGLMGYSLGGYIAAIAACLRSDLDAVVIAAAGDSVVSPILDTRLGVNVREDLSRSGMHRREILERAWGIISPGRLPLRVPKERVMLLAGRYDGIMLPSSVRRLREAWGRPATSWEPQSHYTLLAVPGRVVRRALPFLTGWLRPEP